MLLNSILLAVFLFNTSSLAHTADYTDMSRIESDSGVKFPTYEAIQKQIDQLEAKYPKQAKAIRYGRTVKGRDLILLRIGGGNTRSANAAPAVQISGAIHGNEFLGIEDKLGEYFLQHQSTLPGLSLFLATGGVIYLVPVVNPDGFVSRARENVHNVDLNRNFDLPVINRKGFTEPETKFLASYLDQDLASHNLKLSFALDYHCCLGAFLMPWGYKNAYPTQNDLTKFNEIAAFEKQTLGYKVGNPMQTVGYNALGNSMDYFYLRYGTLAFAIEGKYKGEESVFNQHVQLLDAIFRRLATAKTL